jgi:TRAP-type C4-dicarboxylate transport system permease small subunit
MATTTENSKPSGLRGMPNERRQGMKKIIGYCFTIFDRLALVSGAALLGMMIVTLLDVIFRVANQPFKGSMEIVVNLMVCIVFFGVAKCALEDGMIKIDIFSFGRAKTTVDAINSIVTAILCCIIGWQCFRQSQMAYSMGTVSSLLKIPKWIFQLVSAFGMVSVGLAVPIRIAHAHFFKDEIPAVHRNRDLGNVAPADAPAKGELS